MALHLSQKEKITPFLFVVVPRNAFVFVFKLASASTFPALYIRSLRRKKNLKLYMSIFLLFITNKLYIATADLFASVSCSSLGTTTVL